MCMNSFSLRAAASQNETTSEKMDLPGIFEWHADPTFTSIFSLGPSQRSTPPSEVWSFAPNPRDLTRFELLPEGLVPFGLPLPPFKTPLDFRDLAEEWKHGSSANFNPPHSIQVTVLIANHLKAFRTKSERLSDAGLFIKDLLPIEFSQHYFEVVLIHEDLRGQKTFYCLKGKASQGPMRTRRILLETITPSSDGHLRKIIQTLVERHVESRSSPKFQAPRAARR